MQWARCTALVLCAFLVIASLDSIPDPPATRPPSGESKALCLREFPTVAAQHAWKAALPVCCHVPVRFVAIAHQFEARKPSPGLVLSRYASDPSPPAA